MNGGHHKNFDKWHDRDVKLEITLVDEDAQALQEAAKGVYPAEVLMLPKRSWMSRLTDPWQTKHKTMISRYFQDLKDGTYQVGPELTKFVGIAPVALTDFEPAVYGQYDAVIYNFAEYRLEDKETQDQPRLTRQMAYRILDWMKEDGYFHWLADYNRPAGEPRTPYTPKWHIHQPRPTKSAFYNNGKTVIDHDVINPAIEFDQLKIQSLGDGLSDEARRCEDDTTNRPGGAFPDDFYSALDLMHEGAETVLAGLNMLKRKPS